MTCSLFFSVYIKKNNKIKQNIILLIFYAFKQIQTEGAKIKLSEDLGEKLDNKARLEFVRQEEAALKQEMEEQATADEELRKMVSMNISTVHCFMMLQPGVQNTAKDTITKFMHLVPSPVSKLCDCSCT